MNELRNAGKVAIISANLKKTQLSSIIILKSFTI